MRVELAFDKWQQGQLRRHATFCTFLGDEVNVGFGTLQHVVHHALVFQQGAFANLHCLRFQVRHRKTLSYISPHITSFFGKVQRNQVVGSGHFQFEARVGCHQAEQLYFFVFRV